MERSAETQRRSRTDFARSTERDLSHMPLRGRRSPCRSFLRSSFHRSAASTNAHKRAHTSTHTHASTRISTFRWARRFYVITVLDWRAASMTVWSKPLSTRGDLSIDWVCSFLSTICTGARGVFTLVFEMYARVHVHTLLLCSVNNSVKRRTKHLIRVTWSFNTVDSNLTLRWLSIATYVHYLQHTWNERESQCWCNLQEMLFETIVT